jgi:hypothetical protein
MTDTYAPELTQTQIVDSIYYWINQNTWAPGIAFPTGYNTPTKTSTCRNKDFYYCVSNGHLWQYQGGDYPNGTWSDLGTAAKAITSCGTAAPAGGTDGDLYNKYDSGQIYQKIDGTWRVIGSNFLLNECNKGLPLGSGAINFTAKNFENEDPDEIIHREANLGLLLVHDDGSSPILATDQSFLAKKDISAGGFLATNQGEVWVGHGRANSTDVPKIILMHTSPYYTNPEYDILYIKKSNGDPGHLDLGNVTAHGYVYTNNLSPVPAQNWIDVNSKLRINGDLQLVSGHVVSSLNPSGSVSLGSPTEVWSGVVATTTYTNNLAPISPATTINISGAINVSGTLDSNSLIHGGGSNGDAFEVGDDIYLVDVNEADTVCLQGAQNRANARILFGSGKDTNLYRNSANQLKTDDVFVIAGNFYSISLMLPNGGIMFGGDTFLYRSAADLLRTSDTFQAAGYKSSDGTNGATADVSSGTLHFKNGLFVGSS